MKSWVFFFTVSFCCLLTSCTDKSITDIDGKQALMETIASDELYLNYLRTELDMRKHYHQETVPSDQFFQMAEKVDVMCSLADEAIAHIAYALEYRSAHCAWYAAIQEVRTKYPQYKLLSSQDKVKLHDLTRGLIGFDYMAESMAIIDAARQSKVLLPRTGEN